MRRATLVVLMDADLQDQPEVIPEFVTRHARAPTSSSRAGALAKKDGSSVLAYRLSIASSRRLSDTKLPLDSGDFALLGAPVVAALRRLPERERYLRGLRAWVGFTQVGIDVDRQARAAGTPKYTTWKLIKLAVDGVCSFSIVPLRAAAVTGLVGHRRHLWRFRSTRFMSGSSSGRFRPDSRPHCVIMTFLSGRPAALPRHHRRVPRPRLRRGQRAPAIYRGARHGTPTDGCGRTRRPMRDLYRRHWWWRVRERILLDKIRQLLARSRSR